jgi:formylglycine-generating enzyme required for sulfatase activity
VTQEQLEQWLTDYYQGAEWRLPRGEARQRGRAFLDSVQRHSNLLLERGERQYGFLHLTLEEMLAAQGIVQRLDEQQADALALFRQYLLDPAWQETLQLAIGFIGVIQRRPRVAGEILQELFAGERTANQADKGRSAIFAGTALLDMGVINLGHAAASKVEAALVQTMQAAACPIRTRRDAGDLFGSLGWTPELAEGDVLLAPAGSDPTGLDAFRYVPDMGVWMGKYPVTNRQFARFIEANAYKRPEEYWSDAGRAWLTGASDSKAPERFQAWLKNRSPDKRNLPYWWDDRKWNSPLFPVVGITWFEAEAYAHWLTTQLRSASPSQDAHEMWEGLVTGRLIVRLPTEDEWEAAIGGRGDYPWGSRFDPVRLNCAESWTGQSLSDDELLKWIGSDAESWREASTTAVTTYPQGVSKTGVWDSSGNVWEWMTNSQESSDTEMPLRGGAWGGFRLSARVSYRARPHPGSFYGYLGVRVVVAPVLQ